MADTTPPKWATWTRERPFDQAVFMDKPRVPVIAPTDKAGMAAAKKREQSLTQQGIKLLTTSAEWEKDPENYGRSIMGDLPKSDAKKGLSDDGEAGDVDEGGQKAQGEPEAVEEEGFGQQS